MIPHARSSLGNRCHVAKRCNNGDETGRIQFWRSTVSNTKLSEHFLGLTKFRGESSVSSSQPTVCVCRSELTVFFAEFTEFAAELSELSLRNGGSFLLAVGAFFTYS